MKIQDLLEKKNELTNHFSKLEILEFSNSFPIHAFGVDDYDRKDISMLLGKIVKIIKKLGSDEYRATIKKICVEIEKLRILINIEKDGKITILNPNFKSTALPILKIKNMNERLFDDDVVNDFKIKETSHALEQFEERELFRKKSSDGDRIKLQNSLELLTVRINKIIDNSDFSLNFAYGCCYFNYNKLGFGFALNKRPKQIVITTYMPNGRNNFKDDNVYFEI